MHPLFEKADALSNKAIGAAIEVHRALGPGLLESIYERCLVHELSLGGLRIQNQREVAIAYKGLRFTENLRFDVLIEECLLIEIKAVEAVLPVHKAQLLSYMKLMNVPVGLLFNFHDTVMKNGVARLVLPNLSKSTTQTYNEAAGIA